MMKRIRTVILVTAMLLCMGGLRAQAQDSVDVLDYDISLDLSQGSPFAGKAVVTLQLLRPCSSVQLQLVGTVDSVALDGTRLASPTLSALPTAGIAAGVPFTVTVWYTGHRNTSVAGWGGIYFDNDMHYNLGASLDAVPHPMGRAWFPCRDNFTDKATYTFRVKARAGWTAECGGMLQSRTVEADGTERSVWRIDQPACTYLASVSQAAWKRLYDSIPSLYGTYPVTYGYLNPDSTMVRRVFAELDSVVPMYERCFGPYRWGRIGYIATNQGSMEHVNNIGLAEQAMESMIEMGQTTIAHELGHSWFGNLITCATAGDMWINEGGASFCTEVAMQSVGGREASDDYYQRNLESVLRTTHIADNGYRPLHDMPQNLTYGSTTYDKGWMVWHSLRGYLGEERFYRCMNTLMERCAFGNLDAYQLRDSLSLYSGVDLADFFDFHVCTAGFVDYHVELTWVDGRWAEVEVHAQGVGTTALPARHWVPVAFFSADGQRSRQVLEFEGDSWDGFVELPFEPSYCVLDAGLELSDAATLGHARLSGGNTVEFGPVHTKASAAGDPVDLYVEHHWGGYHGTMPGGVVRTIKRYWMVRGDWDAQAAVAGGFRYARVSTTYPNLDRGFIPQVHTLDSVALMYRAPGEEYWKAVSYARSGNYNEGFFLTDSLLPGEYTLAVVDSTHLAIPRSPRPAPRSATLFPNPLTQGQALTVQAPTDAPFAVTIVDTEGRPVWHREGCRNGEKMHPDLPRGTYFVRIENNFISLQSKLIQL